ncbi:MAG: Repeat domain in Vibrio, Colwellia, Bradyrhizobium and Shewanella [Labilithrix sp.]|nr:Repeat domain in Vibrio, Colwellia, Bradyrhizobium and Shewanella [Labilithrix sp.]
MAGGQGGDILRGSGDGTFALRETIATPGESPTNLTLGDFNGDGKLDAVVVNDNNKLQVLLNACP